ncbi:MAG: aminotransferase class III-fold pyridoxal phosphate-dependent enzyme [Armatimonadetes bacterium]|nr:aminotransferase class III-fold pyridoxal phosphate-dependent enzyme [Candidatus Hippobium faecium]
MNEKELENLSETTIDKYRKYVNPAYANILAFGGFSVPEDRAEGVYVYDKSGRKFLDCVGGYGAFSLGHLNPNVVKAVKDQLEKEALKSHFFMSCELADACEMLAEVLPGDICYSFLCNSGTEAVEGALKCARVYTKRSGFVSAVNGFHGKSFGSLSVSGREVFKSNFRPLLDNCVNVPFNDTLAMREAVTEDTAAVILEGLQGEGGVYVGDKEYMQAVRKICDEKGALLIMDEVRTGFGRTGKWFVCEHFDIVPDIITMAKALGGGVMPVGAFAATPKVWNAMFGKNPFMHSTTFGGNPLACAAVMAAIKETKRLNAVEEGARKGEKMLAGLKKLKEKYPDWIKDVRGLGMVAGLEFEDDDIGSLLIASCGKRDLLVAYSLNNPKVIRIEPPLIIPDEEIDRMLSILDEALAETFDLIKDL